MSRADRPCAQLPVVPFASQLGTLHTAQAEVDGKAVLKQAKRKTAGLDLLPFHAFSWRVQLFCLLWKLFYIPIYFKTYFG